MEMTHQDRKEMRERAKAFGERVKYTPGPWRQCAGTFNSVTPGFHVMAGFRHIVNVGEGCVSSRALAEQEANAHLIAAAPELLSALRRAVMPLKCLVDNVGSEDAKARLAEAMDAIAKAEGKGA